MDAKDQLVEQLIHLADMLLPFAAGISPTSLGWNGHGYDSAESARTTDPGALQWYEMITVAASLLDCQSSSLNEKQLEYLRRIFMSGTGSFQDFKLSGEQVWANKKLDMERDVLFALLANYRPESVQAS
jgi:hypothetical protein